MNEQAAAKLYKNLQQRVQGFSMGEPEFYEALQDEEKRKKLHQNMLKRVDGFTMDYPAFNAQLGFGVKVDDVEQSASTPAVSRKIKDNPAPTTEAEYQANLQRQEAVPPNF